MARMSRETKFGYGFLFAGIGLPFLIEKLLGSLVALIVAAVCLVLGMALLLAGHLHREDPIGFAPLEPVNWPARILTALLLFTTAGSLLIAIVRFSHKRSTPESAISEPLKTHNPGSGAGSEPVPNADKPVISKSHAVIPSKQGIDGHVPKVKQWSVSVEIPFLPVGDVPGIMWEDPRSDDALLQIYTFLASLDRRELRKTDQNFKTIPVPDDEARRFTTDALHYFILRQIAEMQEPTTTISWDAQTGAVHHTEAAIPVPEAEPCSGEDLESALKATKFAAGNAAAGERSIFWSFKHFALPRGSKLSITPNGVVISKASVYKLQFDINYVGKNVGVLPPHFQPVRWPGLAQSSDVIELMFTISIRFEWYGEYAEEDPYLDWASSLTLGLKKNLEHG